MRTGSRRRAIAKDQQFRETSDSPVPKEKRDALLPLPYFPVDPGYTVPAALKLSDDRPVFEMPTSTGALRKMQLVARSIHVRRRTAKPRCLRRGRHAADHQPLRSVRGPHHRHGHAAGRYLDIEPTTTGYYTIDFNRAYNPYCACLSYECPFPPPSNRLNVEIRAGEKAPGA